jgi:hypothetical protein
MMFEPLSGRREVTVTERRTMQDPAHCLRYLADIRYPDAEKIIIVTDNLNTRPPASLYAAFDPGKRGGYAGALKFITPEHGSWLNMAGLETGVISRRCPGQRIAAIKKAAYEVEARVTQRGSEKPAVRWQFAAAGARVKLQHLYPRI